MLGGDGLYVDSVKRGLLAGLKTTWTLGKIIFPVTLIVTILQYTLFYHGLLI